MKHHKKPILHRILILAGSILLVSAITILVLFQWNIHASRQQSLDCVQALRALIPSPQSAVLEERRDNAMPVLSLEGTDFMGILEFPLYDSVLPVSADWGNPLRYPHRLSGSIYDSSLQIGGTSQAGQYDFYRQVSVGDSLFFTDMEGNRYTLEVTNLRYEKHADQAALQRYDAPLTLFIKNIYAFDYLIVFCNSPL